MATTTASRSSLGTARATHVFEISGYSQHKGLGRGKSVRSATFTVDEYEWCVIFYPDGDLDEDKDYVSVFLELLTLNAQDDRLVIKCDVTVLRGPQLEETAPDFGFQVPPSDLFDNLGKLLESGEEADVLPPSENICHQNG
uniref:Uncharacterized protein n=1 Tax=Aegilops tauschii TaxID=37682 RepID=M8BJA0_AEGTA